MAKSKSIGGIYAELSLKDARFRKGLKAAGDRVKRFGSMAVKSATVAGAAMAAGLAVGSKKALTMGADLNHMATQTGVAVKDLMVLRQAFEDNGVSSDNARLAINKMQKVLVEAGEGMKTSKDALAALHLTSEKLGMMTTVEQFRLIGERLKGIEDPGMRAATAMRIFGRAGAELQSVFAGTKLADVEASLGRMPQLVDQFSGAMERADTLLGRLPNKSDQFFAGFTAGIVGQVLPGLEMVNDKDFTTLGEKLGDSLAFGLEALTSGKVWELFGKHAEIAFLGLQNSPGMNAWAAHLNAIWDGITSKAGDGFDYDKSVENYKKAGSEDASQEIIRLLEEIEGINREIEKGRAGKKAGAGAMSPSWIPYGGAMSPVPDWLKPEKAYSDLPALAPAIAAAAAEEKQERRTWEGSSYEVNSMQARGLAMGRHQIGKEGEKQSALLSSIRDILKEASVNGGLIWT